MCIAFWYYKQISPVGRNGHFISETVPLSATVALFFDFGPFCRAPTWERCGSAFPSKCRFSLRLSSFELVHVQMSFSLVDNMCHKIHGYEINLEREDRVSERQKSEHPFSYLPYVIREKNALKMNCVVVPG